ncbi:hypothetical protein BBJ28_00018435, partial [Nothophytophthora sp. Chile5]
MRGFRSFAWIVSKPVTLRSADRLSPTAASLPSTALLMLKQAEETPLLRVPLRELQTAIHGARAALEQTRQLTAELARSEDEAKTLELQLAKRQQQLASVATSSTIAGVGHSSSRPGGALTKRFRPRSDFVGSNTRQNLIGEQAETLNELLEREESVVSFPRACRQLRALMEAMREISQTSESLDVVSNALRAAQHVLPAEKYTLGLLNEKKDRVALYSTPPMDLPGKRYLREDGSILVDSATTFGRVVLVMASPCPSTGTPLEVADVDDSKVFDVFEEQLELLEFKPEALLCAPIFNVHGVLVGVFQVVTRKQKSLPERGLPASPTSFWSPSSAIAKLSRKRGSTQQHAAFTPREKEGFAHICVTVGRALWNLSLAKAHQLMQGRIECLLKLNRNISAELSTSSVLHQVIVVSYELLRAEHIALYVRDEGNDEFYLFVNERRDAQASVPAADGLSSRATSEKPRRLPGRHRPHGADDALKAHNGIVGQVMRTGQLVLTNSAASHPAFDRSFDDPTSTFRTNQVLCAPVKDAAGHVLAVVCATNKLDGDEFTADDALYLNYAAEAAGISLHKSNLLRAVLASQRLTEARLRLAAFVNNSGEGERHGAEEERGEDGSAAESVTRFVRVVMAEGKKLLRCDRFGFLLVDPLKKELWITQEDGESVRMPLTKGLSGLIATSGKPVCTRDAYTHPHFDPTLDKKTGYHTTSVLGMPVFEDHTPNNPKIVAVVMAINKRSDDDDEQQATAAAVGPDGQELPPSSRGRAPFTASDFVNMTRYCREIQFALGRLSLDISYYKVISDCGLDEAETSSQTNVNDPTDDVNEPEIVSSIVHKFCQASELDALETAATAAFEDDPDEEEEEEGAQEADQASDPSGEASPEVTPAVLAPHRSPPRRLSSQNADGRVLGVGDVTRWDFSCLDLSNADMFAATAVLFRSLGLLERFQV